MKKIISVIFMVAILVNIIVAEPYLTSVQDNTGSDKFDDYINNIIISIVPFSGSNNVNMRSENYPQRENGAYLIFPESEPALSSIKKGSNLYISEHMVALGGVEGVPTARELELSRKDFDTILDATGQNKPYHKVVLGELSDVLIHIESSTDFNYVSQDRNIYERPYKLYVSPRYAGSSTPDMKGSISTHGSMASQEIDPDMQEAKLALKRDENASGYSYTNSWFDLILALPYDEYNDNGVIYDSKEYALRDSNDYTSSIEIKLIWRQPYQIFENIGDLRYSPGGYTYFGEIWEKKYDGFIEKQTSISIPFAGYSSPIDPEYKETTASLIVMPMPAASQLSLNDGDTGPGHEEDVAEIQFLMNFPKYYTGTTTSPQNVWMFLSASPSPFSRNNNGFVLVHQNAGNILTSYNSASYKAYVIDEATGAKVEFDGKAIATDYDPLNKTGNDVNYIATHCNIDGNGGVGDYLPHEYDSEKGSNTYHHYHEYQGTVSVEIEDTALKPDGMLAGQYTSKIYIHVMTSY